jgi:surface antigen
MPNDMAYAWGRFYEISGERPKLDINKLSKDWFANIADGYERSQIPRLGSIACWSSIDSSGKATDGHVAIVEEVKYDGTIVVSHAATGVSHFWTSKIDPKDSGTYNYSDSKNKYII